VCWWFFGGGLVRVDGITADFADHFNQRVVFCTKFVSRGGAGLRAAALRDLKKQASGRSPAPPIQPFGRFFGVPLYFDSLWLGKWGIRA
jgi:hypothetical protein